MANYKGMYVSGFEAVWDNFGPKFLDPTKFLFLN